MPDYIAGDIEELVEIGCKVEILKDGALTVDGVPLYYYVRKGSNRTN